MEFITTYLQRGFGSMNKNDLEVWVFNQLLQDSNKQNYSDYDFSIELRIPQTKVKRLRYEAALVYQQKTSEEYNQTFLKLLQKAKIKSPNSDIIQFSMEDKGLYLYVDNILKKEGRFSDRSHNNEIMQICKEDLVHLLTHCLIPLEEQEDILRKCEEMTSQKLKFSDVAIKMIDKFIEGLVASAGASAWVFTKANMLNLIQLIF
jgi:hypothetical protein